MGPGVRGRHGRRDSRAPLLFWEEAFPVPGYAFDEADVRSDLPRPSSDPPDGRPTFFSPRGPVLRWYDLEVNRRRVPRAAWVRDDPALAEMVVLSWQPGLLDRWTEEDEEVASHPRDPYKRVEALPSSRHVTVRVEGTVLADTTRPVLLFETGLPTRYYLPRDDVRLELLRLPRVAWSYPDPFPAVGRIAGRIAFYNELVDITVDGVATERPVSVFSEAANRPAG